MTVLRISNHQKLSFDYYVILSFPTSLSEFSCCHCKALTAVLLVLGKYTMGDGGGTYPPTFEGDIISFPLLPQLVPEPFTNVRDMLNFVA